MIQEHNGHALITDAFFHRSNSEAHFTNQLADSDIAVMVQNYNKHHTSKLITDICSDHQIKFAIANSLGLQSIEQAIYRAYIGLPSYEPNGTIIDYPVKTQN